MASYTNSLHSQTLTSLVKQFRVRHSSNTLPYAAAAAVNLIVFH